MKVMPLLCTALLAAGCASFPADPHRLTWQGIVQVRGTKTIPRGSTLTILPGTRILFADGPGGEPGSLVVEGGLEVNGTEAEPVLFDAADPAAPSESWEGIVLDHVAGFSLRWARITRARYALHAHFSSGEAFRCRFDHNLEGGRIGRSAIRFTDCRFDHNLSKGLSMTDSANRITGCTVTANRYGLFLFEGSRGDVIEGNNLAGNEVNDLRLGDFFTGSVSVRNNWWGTLAPGERPRTDPEPAPDGSWPEGIAAAPFPATALWTPGESWHPAWSHPTGGFVDAAPAVAGGVGYVGSWDGVLRAIDLGTGDLLWSRDLGAPIDATPAIVGGTLLVPAWDRTLHALDLATGTPGWRFSWEESGFDDHRQGGVVTWHGLALLPAWNGSLYALDPADGSLAWRVPLDGALRAAPAVTDTLVVAATDRGQVAAILPDGRTAWALDFGEGIRTTPLIAVDRVILAGRGGRMAALATADGKILWERRLGGVEYASPCLWQGLAVIASVDGKLTFLDPATGAIRLAIDLGSPLYAPPIPDGETVVVAGTDGTVTRIDPATGMAVRRIMLGSPIQAAPVKHGGALLIADRSGRLVRLEETR